jgi:hypothetical protein
MLVIDPVTTSFTPALYTLQDDFYDSSFLSGFDFMSGQDPMHGFVRYVHALDHRLEMLKGS